MKTPALLFAATALLLASCTKEKENPAVLPTLVSLQINDPNGQPVPNIPVALYNNQLDWATEQNPVQTATTTATGVAQFSHLTRGDYYVNAAQEDISNWESGYRIDGIQQSQSNQATIPLREYRSRKISRATGKVWHLVQYRRNGIDLTNDPASLCFTDNRWIFYKGAGTGRFELDEGETTCTPTDPQISSGTWQILDNGTKLELPENGAVVSYNLEFLSATTIRYNRQIGADVYSYILQAQ